MAIFNRNKNNAHTDPLFKSLNLFELKDLFELSVFKVYVKFRHDLLPVYTLNILRNRSEITIMTSGHAKSEYIFFKYNKNQ